MRALELLTKALLGRHALAVASAALLILLSTTAHAGTPARMVSSDPTAQTPAPDADRTCPSGRCGTPPSGRMPGGWGTPPARSAASTDGSDKAGQARRGRHGSVQLITDEDSAPASVKSFSAFGSPEALEPATTAATRTRSGYTGHETHTETGLVNMGGRLYDARVGRVLQADPPFEAPWSQGLNRYSYALNNAEPDRSEWILLGYDRAGRQSRDDDSLTAEPPDSRETRQVLHVSKFVSGSTTELFSEARLLLPGVLKMSGSKLSELERARLRDTMAGSEGEFRRIGGG